MKTLGRNINGDHCVNCFIAQQSLFPITYYLFPRFF